MLRSDWDILQRSVARDHESRKHFDDNGDLYKVKEQFPVEYRDDIEATEVSCGLVNTASEEAMHSKFDAQ